MVSIYVRTGPHQNKRVLRKKVQFFTISKPSSNPGDCGEKTLANWALGRVFDNRKEYDYIDAGAKFPIGYWKKDEPKKFKAKVRNGSNVHEVEYELTVKDINCTYEGQKFCLHYHYRTFEPKEIRTYVHDEDRGWGGKFEYVYCPRRGMMYSKRPEENKDLPSCKTPTAGSQN